MPEKKEKLKYQFNRTILRSHSDHFVKKSFDFSTIWLRIQYFILDVPIEYNSIQCK